jgi:hypothetical protein
MILYRPTDGDVQNMPITIRPRTCFLMTKLGNPISGELSEMRKSVTKILREFTYECIDANSMTTGKDFLLKIWNLAMGVPVGIAIIDETIKPQTMANIFYEMGWMQAHGKETIVIKSKGVKVPSDFVRTEYIEFNESFDERFRAYFENLEEQAKYFALAAKQLDNNPLLSIDYYRRAFLITGSDEYKEKTLKILENQDFSKRAKSSVELLHSGFATGHQIVKKSDELTL